MSSNDYCDYITRLVRTPIAVTIDVPRYGNAPMFFRNSRMTNVNGSREKEDIKENVDQNKISHAKKKQNHPRFRENVQAFEYEQSSKGSYVMTAVMSRMVPKFVTMLMLMPTALSSKGARGLSSATGRLSKHIEY